MSQSKHIVRVNVIHDRSRQVRTIQVADEMWQTLVDVFMDGASQRDLDVDFQE